MAKIETVFVKSWEDLAKVVGDNADKVCLDINDLTKRVVKLEKMNKKLGLVSLGLLGLLYLHSKRINLLTLKVNEFSNRLDVNDFVKNDQGEENDLK